MNILVLGSGGREHALTWKLAQSPKTDRLFVAPGNAGTAEIATNIALSPTQFEDLKTFILQNNIQLVVVGPEDPLVKGIVDYFKNDEALKDVLVIGPSKQGAQLEGSKEYAKIFLEKNNIPTAKYQSFTKDTIREGEAFLENLTAPYVLKADGLAAGKGVLILNDLEEAKKELNLMLRNAKFGVASSKVVIEEFLDGIELSCFVLTDGLSYKILPAAKDYKRIGEGDTGLNTGGMGAISPVPFATEDFLQKVKDRIVIPTINGLKNDAIDYKGFVFIGLIKVGDDPYVIEYNVRMGDPETEVVIPRIQSDLLDLLVATASQKLDEVSLEIDNRAATTVMMVSGGYPEDYEKGKEISGLDKMDDAIAFHAGTTEKEGKVVTSGGRVIAVTAYGNDYKEALEKSYKNIQHIDFDRKYYRTDLGFDL